MDPSIFVIYQMYYVYEWGCSPRINLLKYEVKTSFEDGKYKYIGVESKTKKDNYIIKVFRYL